MRKRMMKGLRMAGIGVVALSGVARAGDVLPETLLSALDVQWPRNRAINIVFHGHSVPAGYHRTPDVKPFESYPHLVYQALKKDHPYAVINVIVTAIGGENSVSGAARFERDVLCHKPDVIFVDYALNDRRLPIEQVEAAWNSMIDMARTRKIPIVLITPTGDSGVNFADPADPLCQRAELIRRLARDRQVPLADVFAAWKGDIDRGTPIKELLSQSNHPNLRGHELAARVIAGLFRKQ